MKIDKNRRNFFKIALIGGGALLLAKVFGPRLLSLGSFSGPEKEYLFENFRVVENKNELTIFDRSGEAILIIDK